MRYFFHLFLIVILSILSVLHAQSCIMLADECCPAQSTLVFTCGNQICDYDKGETPTSCPWDCTDLQKKPLFAYGPLMNYCDESWVYYPSTIEEVKDSISEAVTCNQELRPLGARHSGNFALCSQGEYLVLSNLTKIHGLEIYEGETVVRVEPGVTLWQLNIFLSSQNKALGFATPSYGGITIAGAIANDAHGSNSLPDGASIITLVRSIDKMNQRGDITTYGKHCSPIDDWKSVIADQGLMGVTVELRIKVRDNFNVETTVLKYNDQEFFSPGSLKKISDACAGYIFMDWYRPLNMTVVTCSVETSKNLTAPDTKLSLYDPPLTNEEYYQYIALLQAGACDKNLDSQLEYAAGYNQLKGNYIQYTKNGTIVYADTGVGESFRMIQFLERRPLSSRDFEVTIPEVHIDEALKYYRKIMTERNMTLSFAGLAFRVGRYNNDSWLGHSSVGFTKNVKVGDRFYYIEAPRYWPQGFTDEQLNELDKNFYEIMLYLVKNFQGKLHPGKNHNNLWSEKIIRKRYQKEIDIFQKYVDKFDPYGVFSNPLAEALGIEWYLRGHDFSDLYAPRINMLRRRGGSRKKKQCHYW